MKLTEGILQIDSETIQQKITRFIKDYVRKTKTKGIVLGISGGVDSATAAALSTIAIGADRVLALFMPEEETHIETDDQHIKLLSKEFKFQLLTVDLTQILSTLYGTIPDFNLKDKLSRGNLKARTRMLIWYYYANSKNRIVVGSSDKSETMLGYCTKWGDAAADIAPVMDLYKTQVRQLANHIGIPLEIIKKPSTPALWPNQMAEKELGMKYETLDLILYGLEHFMLPQKIAEQLNLPTETIVDIKEKWLRAEHKRRMPLTTKLKYRTINADFRLARTIKGDLH
ncbi:MAG: NAD+ synthase [Candidatus Bathyarchaeota archaeon]|nr:MAG: NAD+ synthase [Candidatus Bathyarchaeota archaeon]